MNSNAPVFGTGSLSAPVASRAQTPIASVQTSRGSVWLHRVWLVIFVIFCVELGMLLSVLPWTRVWTDNSLLAAHSGWHAFLRNNFVRGVITGVGLVDVWIGIWEAVHYRDPGKKKI